MRKVQYLGIGIIVVLLLSWTWYRFALGAVDPLSTERVMVTIPKGTSVTGIARLLEEKDLIQSTSAFTLYVRIHGIQGSLKAGTFLLRPSMDTPAIAGVLQSGESAQQSVTIPEGFTVKDIDALLADMGLTQTGSIVGCAQTCDFPTMTFLPQGASLADRGGRLEGYLFPETYFIEPENFTPKAFLERMLMTFETRVFRGLQQDVVQSGKSLHQILTMASLIEEEARNDDERPIIADILWKRLTTKGTLGVDATVRYIVDKPRGEISIGDLNMNSPYNTRKFKGLPPGPIANPGLASVRAALHPQSTSYWYYLHGTDGRIHYAETNEEHAANKRRYL